MTSDVCADCRQPMQLTPCSKSPLRQRCLLLRSEAHAPRILCGGGFCSRFVPDGARCCLREGQRGRLHFSRSRWQSVGIGSSRASSGDNGTALALKTFFQDNFEDANLFFEFFVNFFDGMRGDTRARDHAGNVIRVIDNNQVTQSQRTENMVPATRVGQPANESGARPEAAKAASARGACKFVRCNRQYSRARQRRMFLDCVRNAHVRTEIHPHAALLHCETQRVHCRVPVEYGPRARSWVSKRLNTLPQQHSQRVNTTNLG